MLVLRNNFYLNEKYKFLLVYISSTLELALLNPNML